MAKAPRDFYKVLGVSRKASTKDIKQAYRRLARQYHPDVTGDDEAATQRFREITEAYDTLVDPARRRNYDLFGRPDDSALAGLSDDLTRAFDQLKSLFVRGPTEPSPGVDAELDARVTFQEAWTGARKDIPVTLTRPCATCHGTGTDAGKSCAACKGRGARIQTEQLAVTIPAGVDDGTRLRLKQRGSAGQNQGPPGDLYLRIAVDDDERFERDDDTLFTEVRVGLRDAMLGSAVDVPLPDGSQVTMTVPPGTQGGQVFRLRGKGFPRITTGARGDLLVTVQLRVPRKLGADAHALLQELSEVVPDL